LNLGVVKRIPSHIARGGRWSRWTAAWVLSLVATSPGVLVGCDSDPFQGELTPCRCDVEQCTSASCGYELRLDAGCNPLAPGGVVFPCTRTEPGVASEIIIRGGEWVWGPLTERCMTPGETRLLVLQCIEATQ